MRIYKKKNCVNVRKNMSINDKFDGKLQKICNCFFFFANSLKI